MSHKERVPQTFNFYLMHKEGQTILHLDVKEYSVLIGVPANGEGKVWKLTANYWVAKAESYDLFWRMTAKK